MIKKTTDDQVLIHFLAGMEFAGKPYRGREKDYFTMLDQKIKEYKDREQSLFTPEQDESILKSKNLTETAQSIGRSYACIYARRIKLRRQADG